MSHSNSLRAYDDVKEIFDAALEQKGVRITCETASQAVRMRARLHHFRTLDRALMAEVYPAGDPRRNSIYDPYIVRIIDNTLTIEPREFARYTIEPLTKAEESNL